MHIPAYYNVILRESTVLYALDEISFAIDSADGST